ncbi:MAG TPA: hypothetical protein VGC54_02900 [Planctomycetota bacterium]
MNRRLHAPFVFLLGSTVLVACFNSGQGKGPLQSDKNATAATLRIEEVTNGFGRLLPHVVHAVDPITGAVSPSQLVEIRSFEDLLANPPSLINPVLPPATWLVDTITGDPRNPAGQPGNHFAVVRFSRTLDFASILDSTAGGLSNNGLTGAITVVAYDQATGFSQAVEGRGFINGVTYFGNPPLGERWVAPAGRDHVQVLPVTRNGVLVSPPPGLGYPGTTVPLVNSGFQGSGQFVNRTTFTYVVDSDGDLSTFEGFPTGRVIRVVVNDSVRDKDGKRLEDGGVGTSVVGNDATGPGPLLDGVGGNPVTFPLDLASDVPCDVQVHWSFDESCQPHSVGPLPSLVPPSLTNEFTIEFLPPVAVGQPPPGSTIPLPFTALPVSPFNFTEFVLTPVATFPGSDPFGAIAKAFVTYFHNAAEDLFSNSDPNNQVTSQIEFTIGDCPGLINVPVAPGAIYTGSNGGGTAGGVRVIDLDGFGQGTGDPTFNHVNDPIYDVVLDANGEPIQGDISKFPFNPNLALTDLFPPIGEDSTSIAGGSRGVFQLGQDSTLRTQLVDGSTVGTIADMMLGHPLDIAFNNFDCLSGSQNLCASTAFQVHPLNGNLGAAGNSISHAPHPNPPRIRLAPSCFAPLIQTEEPTFGDADRNGSYQTNALGPDGNPFGSVGGLGPNALLTKQSHYSRVAIGNNSGTFPGPAPTSITCPVFVLRQQIGHYLYVLDSSGGKVIVLNSNRMNVLDVIPVADPRDLAISPDSNILAVSNKGTNTVTFIDTDPNSPTFHKVVKVTQLIDHVNNRFGVGPSEIVWQPDDEDILVICEGSNSMAIIGSGSLEVRKIIPGVSQPKYVAVTNRDITFGFQTNLYYAYVINSVGDTSVFESGPDGVQGIGFDDFIGSISVQGSSGLPNASAVQPNPNSLQHAVYIAYRDAGRGAVAEVHLHDAPTGARSLSASAFLPDPNFRNKEFRVKNTYVGVFSSSSVIDIALDDLSNFGGLIDQTSQFGTNRTIQHSSKSLMRPGPFTVSEPQYLFVANANGKVDVIKLSTAQPIRVPISVPGVAVLCHFWRQ